MEKRVIAVDMDDVVIETAPSIVEYMNNTYGASMELENFYSRDPSLWNAPDVETAIKRVNSFLDTEEYYESPPVQEAVHALRGLQKYHTLYIVTGRPDFTEIATRSWLKNHLPDLFTDVVFTNYFDHKKVKTKGDVCKQLNVDILIDDHIDHCESALEAGVQPILFGNYPWNSSSNLSDGITRVEHWPDIEELLLPKL
jgi:5'(3')-deoxyribonucleotidase